MLYLVATPIGNIEDISVRALRVLKEVDIIIAEDTRRTGMLLNKLGLPKKSYISFYEYNEEKRVEEIIGKLKDGLPVALVSSAGTPCISDPGYKLIRRCRAEQLPLTSLPGACSVINALVMSGLPTDNFFFLGFLPRKSGARRKKLIQITRMSTTLIIFESPYRVGKLLEDVYEVLGDKKAAVVREMTKMYEDIECGLVKDLCVRLKDKKIKGEVVVVIDNRGA